MSVYQQYLVTVRTKFDSIQITIGAMSSGDAARIVQGMYPGSTVTRVELVRPN